MQNAQNAAEIQQRVINLVELYRNYVDEHCSKQYVCDDYVDDNGNLVSLDFCEPISPMGAAFEQLLVTLYKRVAGQEADDKVLEKLAEYANVFFSDALTEDEFSFLCEHFADVCSFCFSNLSSKYLQMPTSEQVVELIKKYIHPKDGDTIFVAESGFCDIAILFPNCVIKGYTHSGHSLTHKNTWALTQIRLYSLGITSKIHENQDDCANTSYLSDVDYVICGAESMVHTSFSFTDCMYKSLPSKCKMLTFMDKRDTAGHFGETLEIRKSLVKDKTIDTLLSYESKNELNDQITENRIFILVDKAGKEIVHLIDNVAGTSKDIAAEMLDSEILWPSYYFAKRPESGIPLSDLVTFVDLSERTVIKDENGKLILPDVVKQMPVAVPAKMAQEYKDANLLFQKLDLAGDQVFDNNWKFWIRPLKEPCVLLYGNKEKTVVGYINEIPKTGIATLDTIVCLIPKEGIDVRYIAALLLTPVVKCQLESICQGYLNDHTFPLVMNKVIVPNHSDKDRVEFLSESNYDALYSVRADLEAAYREKYDAMRTDYINEVRMRKHDMRPHLRQLASSERLMIHYIENCNDLVELKKQLSSQLCYTHDALTILSAIVDHLSDEEKFGKPELLNLDKLLEEIEVNQDESVGFAIEYNCNRESFNRAGFTMPDMIQQLEEASEQWTDMKQSIKSLANENLPLLVEIAPVDFQRLVTNIIDNARNHGFTDGTRTDYYIGIDLSYNLDREMYQIDFSNNGNPLPVGMTKERFGIRGEKAGKYGRTGNGGYIIKAIVSHYGGDFNIFSKDGITTIRIYLPKKN